MRITAIVNLKGGVAKTTTAINLGALLARDHGKRVLLIDADSQCNLTEFFGVTHPMGSLVDLLRRPNLTNFRSLICPTDIPGLDIVPAEDRLMDLDLTAVGSGKADRCAIRDGLRTVADEYDFVLIDCPAAFNAAGAAALVAADDVIIPIKLDAFSMRGMGNVARQIFNMRKLNPDLRIAGVLPTAYYKTEQTEQATDILAQHGYRVFPAIRRSDKVDAMTYEQTPLCIYSPKSASAVDYRKAARAYLGMGGEQQ